MASASCNSSSSEEDDTDWDKFAEIVKSVHLENGNFDTKGRHHQQSGASSSKPSLRHWRRDEEQTRLTTNSYITPEFQKHVAKKLTTFLDSCVQITDANENDRGCPQESCEGIKLLSSAKHTLKAAIDGNKKPSGIKRPSEMYLSSSSEDEEETHRLAEAAVSGYTIIANGSEDVVRGENENPSRLTGDKDHNKHKRKRKKMKEKQEMKAHKSKKKKKRHKET